MTRNQEILLLMALTLAFSLPASGFSCYYGPRRMEDIRNCTQFPKPDKEVFHVCLKMTFTGLKTGDNPNGDTERGTIYGCGPPYARTCREIQTVRADLIHNRMKEKEMDPDSDLQTSIHCCRGELCNGAEGVLSPAGTVGILSLYLMLMRCFLIL